MNKKITLGSLFDGSGGFPLAGIMCGIEPLWASEIDPFCVAVTSRRFPNTQHLGDITKINGAEIPPVDVITFGSPCQDLSVAGKRAGLDGERSGLFMEAVRIIKEMRGATNGEYPKIIIWENVPGAFSSNKGEDFRTVLEEIAKIKDTNVSVPRPPKGKWQTAGCIMGDGYSLAWRVLDAQFWGVPQRRKRIFLVGSFGNTSAAEILFKREGLRGDFKESRKAWKGLTADIERNTDLSSGDFTPKTLKIRCGCEGGGKGVLIQENKSATLSCNNDQILFASFYSQMKAESQCFTKNIANTLVNGTNAGFQNAVLAPKSIVDYQGCSSALVVPTLRAEAHGNEPCVVQNEVMCIDQGGGKSHCGVSKNFTPTITCTHGGEPCVIYDGRGNGDGKTAPTICGDHNDRPGDLSALCIAGNTIDRQPQNGGNGKGVISEQSYTLNTVDRHAVMTPLYSIDRAAFNQGENAQYNISVSEDTVQTLTAKGPSAVCCNSEQDMYENHGQDSRYNGPIDVAPTVQEAYGKGGNTAPFVTEKPIDLSTYIVRRITPLECCRLQGFPDWWCEDIPHKDTPEYRMWGNGVALPCVLYVMEGVAEALNTEILK